MVIKTSAAGILGTASVVSSVSRNQVRVLHDQLLGDDLGSAHIGRNDLEDRNEMRKGSPGRHCALHGDIALMTATGG